MGKSSSMVVAEKFSLYCTVFAAMMLLMNFFHVVEEGSTEIMQKQQPSMMIAGYPDRRPACDEIYEVKEGETLQTISEKCGDPYIVEGNPHIHDHDDLFPGLLIRITPTF
ncbi:PREDICTED: uncharacterized protein LOC104791536 [Camelina sativa]|uniref:Uncharacterized protein LOC104791536 n=1 Tax=Camelina sativa TaxID=90675 RepID=A0ABM0ZHC9_CAMSA|nr:PREDICTED: uncharacterized protein LOC104791536 [Camelina sativa]